MKLIYVANARFPTEKAHGLQIAKTIEALKLQRISVNLILPKRENPISKTAKEYYHLKVGIKPKLTFCIDLLSHWHSVFAYYIQSVTFYLSCMLLLKNYNNNQSIYTRDFYLGFLITHIYPKKRVFLEIHELPETKVGQKTLQLTSKRAKVVVCTNKLLAEKIKFLVSNKKVRIVPNGADPRLYRKKVSKNRARQELTLPKRKYLVVYTGNLFKWKGVYTLAKSSKYLQEGIEIYLIGGSPEELAKFKSFVRVNRLKKVHAIGHKPFEDISKYQQAADVLVAPYSKKKSFSSKYVSPIKLFEYFHADRPIIASDVIAVKQLAKDSILYFHPDDEKDLANKIDILKNDEELQNKLTARVEKLKNQYTWESRAKKIKTIIQKSTK